MNLLEIQDLTVHLTGINPVRGVSLAVRKSEFVGLVGSSGSGKSSLAMAILRLREDARITGRILFCRNDLLKMDEKELNTIRGRRISMIFQEPMLSLNPLHKVGQQVIEVLKYHDLEVSEKKVLDLFRLVELLDAERIYHSYPHELSGGQRQRVMIAMALAGKPDLLIADEPTTALDVTVQSQILKLLKSLQQKLGLSILFITHDLDIIRKYASRVYVMKYGHIVSTHLSHANTDEKIRDKSLTDKKPVLSVHELSVYYDETNAVDDVSFNLYPARTLGLVGESGSGKSSIARALVRLIPATGRVMIDGQDFFCLKGKDLIKARSHIQMVFQDAASSLNPRLSVGDLVAEGWKLHNSGDASFEVEKALKAVGLTPDIMKRYPTELSGGQKTRVALARVLILKPKVLILDEVTSSVDLETQKRLMNLLIEIQKNYKLSYLFISHDLKAVRKMADEVMIMKQSRIVEKATTKQIFTYPKHPYTRKLLKDSFIEIKVDKN